MSPVDYISKTIVHLCSRIASLHHVFHLVNDEGSIPVNRLMDYVISFGFPVKKIPYNDWKKKLKDTKECVSIDC